LAAFSVRFGPAIDWSVAHRGAFRPMAMTTARPPRFPLAAHPGNRRAPWTCAGCATPRRSAFVRTDRQKLHVAQRFDRPSSNTVPQLGSRLTPMPQYRQGLPSTGPTQANGRCLSLCRGYQGSGFSAAALRARNSSSNIRSAPPKSCRPDACYARKPLCPAPTEPRTRRQQCLAPAQTLA
jgi:hypothetical protein